MEQNLTISWALAISVGIIGALITALGFLLYGNFLELKKMVKGLMANDVDKEIRVQLIEGKLKRIDESDDQQEELNRKLEKTMSMLAYLTDSPPNVKYKKS